MSSFKFNGIDGISVSFEQLATLDDETRWSIISAGAEVVKRFQEQALNREFKRRTGQLFGSLKVLRKRSGDEMSAVIAPSGKRKRGSSGKRTYKGRSNGSYQGTNAEVAYILNYGSPRIKATHWMETANEAAGPELADAEAAVWDQYLRSLNL